MVCLNRGSNQRTQWESGKCRARDACGQRGEGRLTVRDPGHLNERAGEAEAMNLGDGLKLETQILNGKTKLILAPYDVQEKASKQVGNRSRARVTALKVKRQPQVLHTVQNNHDRAEQLVLKSRSGKVSAGRPPTNVLKELENKKLAPLIPQNAQQTKADAGKAKPVPTKFTNVPKQRPQQKPAITAEDLRESLVCLTQEQFQQILLTINHGSKPNAQEQPADKDKQETEEQSVTPLLNTTEKDANSGIAEKEESPSTNLPKDVQAGSLFGTFGEREKDKSLQEAKKAQWKRELDEQVALKKKLKETDQEGINIRHREGIESSVSYRTPYSDIPKNIPLNDSSTPDSMFKTSPGTETTDFSPVDRASSFSSPELPAAIRSAFVLGESAPLDHPFSAIKRQQQKKWLEELNKQREEIALRKIQEKQKIQEAEQQDLWAMHFDSFRKRTDNQTPVLQNTATFQLPENLSSSSEPIPAENQQATTIINLQHEPTETRMSIEEEYFQSQKAGFLRTMTALLDPAQIEERDRKRQKQLEHQKAIAAQVEEKRKRKQLEDEQKQQEEQEEEQRLAREQEQLQKQYEEDMFRQKQKEEVLSLKTRELYQSMQKAQEEAQRLKQEQRMRHLLQKGHDVSNLQKNAAGEAVHLDHSRAPSCNADVIPEGSWNAAHSIMKPSVTALISPRRDTAVQTDDLDTGIKSDLDTGIKSKSVSNGLSWRREQSSSPDIPVEFTYQQSKAEQPGKKVRSQRDRSESTKENTIDDIYDHYAKTEKQAREPGRKPDWNRNRPPKKYVIASERYPKGLQKQREESKGRRQMELLHLVEKNSSSNLNARKGYSPERSPVREEAKISHPPEEIKPTLAAQKEEKFQKVDPYYKRSESPPVPAVKNRLHKAQRKSNKTPVPIVYCGNPISAQINLSQEPDKQEDHRPPSSQFVPYVRTKEIYYLDPDAPMSRPSTHDPQYKHTAADQESRQIFSSDHIRDPLLNPNVVRNKDRQQAILRGLSELRKGLLQKQRELETGLMPDV